ncbi:MAG: FAD-dependent oxidoreductase [Bacteroidota bacterium]
MIRLTVDGVSIEVEEGTPLHVAARKAGAEIPVMCYYEGMEHFTSCMVCLVKDEKSGRLLPSCSVSAEEDMLISTGGDEVRAARKTALELLLGEHTGDCEAPCRITCPAGMDIPLMNRLLSAGNFDAALEVVKKDIAMPAMLGRICPAPCEGACRRKQVDEAVSICLLKRFAGDSDTVIPVTPPAETGKKIAVIGAGPAGLAAAWYLRQRGHTVSLWEKENRAGGAVRKEISPEILPEAVLDHEIASILAAGIGLHTDTTIDTARFNELMGLNDALIIAAAIPRETAAAWGLEHNGTGIVADRSSYRVGETKVFAIGSALRPLKMAVRSQGQGKEVAFSIDQLFSGARVTGEPVDFNSRFGRLLPEETAEYLKEGKAGNRLEPARGLPSGFTAEEVVAEAGRCLRCDCREKDNCLLRDYAGQYQADQKHFQGSERIRVSKILTHSEVIYEPSKCIKCGICVRLTSLEKERFGFTFIGRGFDVVIGVPFNRSLEEALTETAGRVVEGCPTGALSYKKKLR